MMNTIPISNAIIADLFGVSRSAVTQSTKNRTVEQDLMLRIAKYIAPKDGEAALEDGTYLNIVHNKAGRLMKKGRMLVERRSIAKKLGRPKADVDLDELMRLIDKVVFILADALRQELKTVKNKILFIFKFVYTCCEVVRKGWTQVEFKNAPKPRRELYTGQ